MAIDALRVAMGQSNTSGDLAIVLSLNGRNVHRNLVGDRFGQLWGVILGGAGVAAGARCVRVGSVALEKIEPASFFGICNFPGFLDGLVFVFSVICHKAIHAPVCDDEVKTFLLEEVGDFGICPV